MRHLDKLDTKVFASSSVYYKKDNIKELVNIFSSLEIIDPLLETYCKIMEDLLREGKFDSLKENPEERKAEIYSLVKTKISVIPDSKLRTKVNTWFDSACSDDIDIELQDELLLRYCWAEFLDRIELEDSKNTPFEDKLAIKPIIPDLSKQKIKNASEILKEIKELTDEGVNKTKIFTTGVESLDELVKMKNSNFAVVAARTTVGKSLFMINQAICNAFNGENVLYVSLEESEPELVKRMMMNIDDADGKEEILEKLHIYTPNSSSPNAIFNDIEQFIAKIPCSIVFIDYMQLMKYPGMNDWDSLRTLTREFKLFAVKNNILLVTASQLRREAEVVGSSLSTLFGSSTLEADANIVIILEPTRRQNVRVDNCTSINISVAKNRGGAQGKIEGLIVDYSKGKICS